MKQSDWRSSYETELKKAQASREQGNEGMARVCARRAAGIVLRAYYAAQGKSLPGSSVMNHLKMLADSQDEPGEVRAVCRHFTLRITPDHVLPEDVDLIADVIWLKETLFKD